MFSPCVWNTSGLNTGSFMVILCCITHFTIFVDSDLLPFLHIHHCFINFMAELLGEIKLETKSGDVIIKHFSLLWCIQVMGPTVLVECLQAAISILFKYRVSH